MAEMNGTPEHDERRATAPTGDPLFSHLLSSKPSKAKGGPLATVTSLVFHGALIALVVYVTQKLQERPRDENEEQVTLFEIPQQEDEPPPPPPPPPPPDQPPPPVTDTEVPKGFQTLAAPDIVPPDIPLPSTGPEISEADFSGEGVAGGRAEGKVVTAENIEAAPTFTPMTVRPELRNRTEVERAMVRHYPAMLRDAGIGGSTLLWFLIDENGRVVKTEMKKTSGHPSLDEAAVKIADIMRFSPAMNRDQKVKVWIEIPIRFTAN